MPRRVDNPRNPYRIAGGGYEVEWLGEPPVTEVSVHEEIAKSALVRNDSPDVPFTWSVNPYRGCQHACAYCYARPGHQTLGFGAGTDFDTQIVVKTNVEERLRQELARKRTRGEWIAFSGVTDPYQPLEASYRLTRACLEACAEFRIPVGVITKSALVRRDVDVLARIAERAGARVFLSIPFADASVARKVEPWAPTPALRFEALRALHEVGVPTGISISPLIPGLNDADVPELLERARDAGARHAFTILLRLPNEVRGVFETRLRDRFPERADRVMSALEECRVAQTSRSQFGDRMRGAGPRWDAIRQLFDLSCRRLGLSTSQDDEVEPLTPAPTERQGTLF
ncbi:MAG: radical SAM protein [Planctomycetota bacterium]